MAANTTNPDEHHLVTFELKGKIELKGKMELKGKSNAVPYNKFKVAPNPKGEMELVNRDSLGLNEYWLQPPKGATQKEIQEFPYWGDRIYDNIKKFNQGSTTKRRVLVYDIRHGEADHNRWKKKMDKLDKLEGKLPVRWGTNPEYKKHPIFENPESPGDEYCIVDPPLTGKGRKDAAKAKELFQKLQKHEFPMPGAVFISPLYRTVQTFECALKDDLDIDVEKCYIVKDLREQQTGNCADISIDEFIDGKRPPAPGSKCIYDWMEVQDEIAGQNPKPKDEGEPNLEARVEKFFRALPGLTKSDCIARVTHSLLNKNTLKPLEVGNKGGNEKVMDKFMLDEGGSIAYVVEVDKVPTATLECTKYKVFKKKKENENRRETAFPPPPRIEAEIMVAKEQKIVEGNKYTKIKQNNIGGRKKAQDRKAVESKIKDDSKEAIGVGSNIASRKIMNGGKNTGTNKNVNGGTSVEKEKTVAAVSSKSVNGTENNGAQQSIGGRGGVDSARVSGSGNNVASKRSPSRNNTGSNMNIDGSISGTRKVGSEKLQSRQASVGQAPVRPAPGNLATNTRRS